MDDIIVRAGGVMLGSRLRRLADRLQAGAEAMGRDCGLQTQPGHMPLLSALWQLGPLTVGAATEATGFSQPAITRAARQLEALGLVTTDMGAEDRRTRYLSLTDAGRETMAQAETTLWPRIAAAVDEACDVSALLAAVAALEAALAERPLDRRPGPGYAIRRFSDALAPDFARINREWIEAMFTLEPVDKAQLDSPRETIIATGGDILFVEDPEHGIVGTCGLLKTGPGEFELIKMGVAQVTRGRGAGEFLLRATIARAYAMGAERLFLLTNAKAQAAIHLYERNGFVHDADILARHGGEYARCDVAMLHHGG